MSEKTMISLPWNDALCKPDQTTASIPSHCIHWQEPAPGEYYLEYSYNRVQWYALNGGNAIPLPTEGLLLTPEIKNTDHNGMEIP